MRFPAPLTIHHACATTAGRYAMHGINVESLPDPEWVRLTATDGRIMASVDMQAKHLGDPQDALPAIVPSELLAKAKPQNRSTTFSLHIGEKATLYDKSGERTVPLLDGEFPKYEAVLDRTGEKFKYTCKLSLNAELLHKLARALGAVDCCLILEVPDNDNTPVRVSLPGNEKAVGAIMRIKQ